MLTLATRVGEAFANLSRRRNGFTANFEDYVANLEAMLGGDSIGVDARDHHALIART